MQANVSNKISDSYTCKSKQSDSLSIQALLNRYTFATKLMNSKDQSIPGAHEIGRKQRDAAVHNIMKLLLANNGHSSFQIQLSTSLMEEAAKYMEDVNFKNN